MTYYPTLAEDLARAKAILAKGKPTSEEIATWPADVQRLASGNIYGADIYAAYKLLESFVQVIEAVSVDVVTTTIHLHEKVGYRGEKKPDDR